MKPQKGVKSQLLAHSVPVKNFSGLCKLIVRFHKPRRKLVLLVHGFFIKLEMLTLIGVLCRKAVNANMSGNVL